MQFENHKMNMNSNSRQSILDQPSQGHSSRAYSDDHQADIFGHHQEEEQKVPEQVHGRDQSLIHLQDEVMAVMQHDFDIGLYDVHDLTHAQNDIKDNSPGNESEKIHNQMEEHLIVNLVDHRAKGKNIHTEGNESYEDSHQDMGQLSSELQPRNDGSISFNDIELAQISIDMLISNFGMPKVGSVLFRNLFKIYPETKSMFEFQKGKDMLEDPRFQKHTEIVVNMIRTLTYQLADFDEVVHLVEELGLRHAKRGIEKKHFDAFKQSLMKTFKAGLKENFSPDMQRAWSNVFDLFMSQMQNNILQNPDILSDEVTARKIELIRGSWQEVLKIGSQRLGQLLFENLFDFNPNLLQVFGYNRVDDFMNSNKTSLHISKVLLAFDIILRSLENMSEVMDHLKQLGKIHFVIGVAREDYEMFYRALITTLDQILEEAFTFEVRNAWHILFNSIKGGMIADNYDQVDQLKIIYSTNKFTQPEVEDITMLWRKAFTTSHTELGTIILGNCLTIHPDLQDLLLINEKQGGSLDETLVLLGGMLVTDVKLLLVNFKNFDQLCKLCLNIRQKLFHFEIHPVYFVILREAILATMEDLLQQEFTLEHKKQVVNMYNFLTHMVIGKDPIQDHDSDFKLDAAHIGILQHSMQRLKMWDIQHVGITVFNNMFQMFPEMKEKFNMKGSNIQMSASLKKQSTSVVTIIGRCIENLQNFEHVSNLLTAIGKEHRDRDISREHFEAMELSLFETIKQLDEAHWCPVVRKCWKIAFFMITEKMMKGDKYDHNDNLDLPLKITVSDRTFRAPNSSYRLHNSDRNLIESNTRSVNQIMESTVLRPDISQQNILSNQTKMFFQDRFKNEVDFHHKVAYRFEKAYRLSRRKQSRLATLNLEVIDCISEFTNYIEQDHMSLFYLLFFCIYYKNSDILEYIRTLIQKIPSVEKINRLLEFIDVNGVMKVRTIGEQVNSFVYHMVFYQAVDDNLRIVYSCIIRQLRTIQLRDSDAIHLLNHRDYEMISTLFDKRVEKHNLASFGYQSTNDLLCHSYRKYNQAYFEEIVINNYVEQRVAQNYRERFIVTALDIGIVFEMYCKEDYVEQFITTNKDGIVHQQFLDLFVICIKNDSMKIAFLIYTKYLRINEVMNSTMLDLIIFSIKDSFRFHEAKLFFIHEHFDVLSIDQLNRILDIYLAQFKTTEFRLHPIVTGFNTIKLALLIYQITWKIEQQQIYSLITKCAVIQDYLKLSLKRFFDRQNNVLVLQKMMMEPVLHPSIRKDSLDIMTEMDMSDLLQHSIVVEVLNLIHEGRYSISSTAISVSYAYQCLTEMQTISLNCICERFYQYIYSLGSQRLLLQSSIQFNIWKQSIYQRQEDEMVLTTMISTIMIGLCVYQTLLLDDIHHIEVIHLHTILSKHPEILNKIPDDELQVFCDVAKADSMHILDSLQIFVMMTILNTLGILCSIIQKLVIKRIKHNVSIDTTHLAIELLSVVCGVLLVAKVQSPYLDHFLSEACARVIKITEDEDFAIDKIYTLNQSHKEEGSLSFHSIISCQMITLVLFQVQTLERTKMIGEFIFMLKQIIHEMLRFFVTFGLAILLYLVSGRLMGELFINHEEYRDYEHLFSWLLQTLKGNPNFHEFKFPLGSTYILSFMVVFRIMLFSLLIAMYVNKYQRVSQNLVALKRYSVLRMKNSISYDEQLAGIVCSFFPINILMTPFIIPLVILRSKRMNDFLLKLQYTLMCSIYAGVMGVFSLIVVPLLYVKMLSNSIFICFSGKRERYSYQHTSNVLVCLILGPVIILIGLFLDIVMLPMVLMKEETQFEAKYQLSGPQLSPQQKLDVKLVFKMLFAGVKHSMGTQQMSKSMSLIELMDLHRSRFGLIEGMHDFVCKGVRDYKQALANVQDYNMTKILTKQCSFPDLTGHIKESKVQMSTLMAIQNDIELFNFTDGLFRRLRIGTLDAFIKQKESESILSIKTQTGFRRINWREYDFSNLGPDGCQFERDQLDFLNNFWINQVVRSFTDTDDILSKIDKNTQRMQAKIRALYMKEQEQLVATSIKEFKNAQLHYRDHIIQTFKLTKHVTELTKEDVDSEASTKEKSNKVKRKQFAVKNKTNQSINVAETVRSSWM